jgi:hypothetical protein
MTNTTAATAGEGVIPHDSFGHRLAIVRAVLQKNYDQLSKLCGELGTPVDSETIRRWERGVRQCSNTERIALVLAQIPIPGTEGLPAERRFLSWKWIAEGGPMPAEDVDQPPGPGQEVLTHWREISADKGRKVA